ncbi:MAG: adenosylmethionine--8-amino-7-oxononanoate transaminase [Proteobacteria bacterium]|nr:adenosylmethionine--8-amino-7-oxononanoate transaminase [Pseudomonadota bacterium]
MNLIKRDLNHNWHPCMQMKDFETFPPLSIKSAEGSYLTLTNGQKLIDANSSWWCKSLGHGHPKLKSALLKQAEQFEHVMFGNTTNETIIALSEKLAELSPNLNKVFYASEGSCAVEIALKMSLHANYLQGQSHRTKFMALKNGYHGETCLALSASDLGLYRKAYESILQPVSFIDHIPYVLSTEDPLWEDCSTHWPKIEEHLNQHSKTLSAIILEPIVQGAGNMKIYSKDFLIRLRQWTTENHIHLIADEIMTGFGRTGYALACEHATIEPDFICLGKGLTAGWLPMSAVLTSQNIYDIFYDDYATHKAFLHSHTHSGNALAAAIALECFKITEEENIYASVQKNSEYLYKNMQQVAEKTRLLQNVRYIGFIAAADLMIEVPRAGYEIYKNAIPLGAFLRPLGNTIYWLPPLNTSLSTLDELTDITIRAIQKTCL